MSPENVEILRRGIDAYNARDVEAFIACCHPEIEIHSAFAAVGGAIYHGHDGMREFFRDFEEVWGDQVHIEPEAYFDLGESTLFFYVLHGRGRGSGAEVAMPSALVARYRADLLVYVRAYAHREDPLAELGVSVEALERIEP
jgi:ketosteroid isomerase-like protein